MNATKLLKQKGIDLKKLVLEIDREEIIERLLEFIKDYRPVDKKKIYGNRIFDVAKIREVF